MTLLALLSLAPLYDAARDRAFTVPRIAQAAVLPAAASGILA